MAIQANDLINAIVKPDSDIINMIIHYYIENPDALLAISGWEAGK